MQLYAIRKILRNTFRYINIKIKSLLNILMSHKQFTFKIKIKKM